ncbi:hypothetical protein Calkro_0707 [Caldicellulosiruptor kronotskyensis 2002]|uniref:Uncharacterized protein n=1 Tax=Caldicellulosiruptor kronotskyensis (strain DSM 18902 / VKM B-2412 / 2002) TaxID=632348 RepID=E4SEW1_CALK2|nr:hypothetical protein Calkro_0707 [Caldicellulosiruptor kronotskyensis 2002]
MSLAKTRSWFGVFKREKGFPLSPTPLITARLTEGGITQGVTPDYIVIISQVHCKYNGLPSKGAPLSGLIIKQNLKEAKDNEN